MMKRRLAMLKRLGIVLGIALLIAYGPRIWAGIHDRMPPPTQAAEQPVAPDEQATPVISAGEVEIGEGSQSSLDGFSTSAQLNPKANNLVEVADQYTSTTYVSFSVLAGGGFAPATKSCYMNDQGEVFCNNIKYAIVQGSIVSVADALPGHTYQLVVREY